MVMQTYNSPMVDTNLGLVGERPPSAGSNRPSLGTNVNHQPQKEACPANWNVHKPDYNLTFISRPASAASNSAKTSGYNGRTHKRSSTPVNKQNASFVDETLFGSARSDISISPSINTNRTSGRRSSTPSSPSRSSSAYGKRGYYRPTSNLSFVDDTLFSKDKAVPKKSDQYDYFGNKIISKSASQLSNESTNRSSSPFNSMVKDKYAICGSAYVNSIQLSDNDTNSSGSAKKIPFEEWIHKSKANQHKILPTKYQVFNSSYVDESLFGPKPTCADFPAPWEKPGEDKKRESPFLFDSKNYSFSHKSGEDVAIIREKGPYLRKSKPKAPVKPVWK